MPDIKYMHHALRLASRQLGRTMPNPAVGCVIVKNGQIVGTGATASGGRPHAETLALEMAGERASEATLYVTLEPCAHHGQTPPCTTAIIEANITRIVIACADPDPRVSGKGFEQLRKAGLEVISGIGEAQALALNEGFFLRIENNRPLVSLKLATSLDGCIATASGDSQWITGESARRYGHALRGQHDAILTGIGTVLADDPLLTCRINGRTHHSPIRIVMDGNGRLPATSKLAQSAGDVPLWILTRDATSHPLAGSKANIITCPTDGAHLSIPHALSLLADRGVTRLLVEAGAQLSTAFIDAKLVDDLYWFRAPLIIGDGTSALNMQCATLDDCLKLTPQERISLGIDTLEVYSLREGTD